MGSPKMSFFPGKREKREQPLWMKHVVVSSVAKWTNQSVKWGCFFLPLTGHRPSVLEQIIYCVIDSSILWIILLFWELHSKLTLGERRRKHWTESTPGWQSMFTSRWRYQLMHISPEKQKGKNKGSWTWNGTATYFLQSRLIWDAAKQPWVCLEWTKHRSFGANVDTVLNCFYFQVMSCKRNNSRCCHLPGSN